MIKNIASNKLKSETNMASSYTALSGGKQNAVQKIKAPPAPLSQLTKYNKLYSVSSTNGVYLLSKAAKRPAHGNTVGPMGWNTKKYPMGGAEFEGLSAFHIIWNASVAYIVYAEASPATEASWLKPSIHPVASRNLPEFLYKLYTASRVHSSNRVRLITRKAAKDLGFSPAFITKMYNHYRQTGSIAPKDEDKLAMVLNNPKRSLKA